MFDASLGWVNKPDAEGYGLFGEYLSFDSMGLRNNDNNIPVGDGPAILAIGDSYTLGLEVDNADTWPSRLEAKSGIKVFNGGVGGYGLGQMLTRAKSLLDKLNRDLDVIIIAFNSEDIERVGQKKQYGIPIPNFTIENDQLVLQEVNLKDFPRTDYFKNIFGYSYVIHLFMSKIFKGYWLEGMVYDDRKYANIDIVEVSCKIIDEFANMAGLERVHNIIFVLLPARCNDLSLSGDPLTQYIRDVSIKNNHVFLIDIQTALFIKDRVLKFSKGKEDKEIRLLFNDSSKGYHGHYSTEGNEFVSQEIFSFLRSVGICQ